LLLGHPSTHHYSIGAGSGSVQIDRAYNSAVNDPSYMLTDALGSTHVIVDAAGQEQQVLGFQNWGQVFKIGVTKLQNWGQVFDL